MGAASSGEEESFETGLLEYPHYTRPVDWEGRTIPEVLRSGDHAKIAAWRHERAIEDTRLRRPDLIERHGGASQAPPSGARHERRRLKTNEPDRDARARSDRRADRDSARSPNSAPATRCASASRWSKATAARVQNFEGVCIARSNKGVGSSFTVRKISFGEGVERVFPLYSPAHRFDRGRAPRRRPPRQALLSARPHRQVGPHRRAPHGPARHPRREGRGDRGHARPRTLRRPEPRFRASVSRWPLRS